MENLRFKTKSEKPENWVKNSRMDYLYGLPIEKLGWEQFHPELTDELFYWQADKRNTTTAPHPFEGKDIKVDLRDYSEEERARFQRKAFALGVKWHGRDQEVGFLRLPFIYIHNLFYMKAKGNMGEDPVEEFESHPYIELTYQQFMDGVWPEEEKKEEKPDAYISQNVDTSGGAILTWINYWDGDQTKLSDELSTAHQYNLMSEEEYKAKHPDPKASQKISFKDYDVKVSGNTVSIGCVITTTEVLQEVFEALVESDAHPEELAEITLFDLYNFLNDNQVKLKL